DTGSETQSVALMWARARIETFTRAFYLPHYAWVDVDQQEQIRQEVQQLGLDYSLVTDWTSFVAVSEFIVNPEANATETLDVPLPMVEGVSSLAYPNQNAGSLAGNTQMASTPEPAAMAGLAVLAGAGALAALRVRRKRLPLTTTNNGECA
ncbi:MAG: PEP-CTERM sorting domain-containing protein, partial [Desulfovibrio sp.]